MGVYKAKPEVDQMVAELIEAHHPELAAVEATVLCQMHLSKSGLALHGYPAYATVRLIPAKDRAAGLPDARITIDAKEWNAMTDAKRRAVLDHELYHLQPVGQWTQGDNDNPKRFVCKEDDAGRPKIKLRKHDWELGGFHVIADRHKQVSVEVASFKVLLKTFRQKEFAWSDDMATPDELEPAELAAIVR